eukprot:scaffold86116_cov41-Cyclotella_meneghiniana.AAC.2
MHVRDHHTQKKAGLEPIHRLSQSMSDRVFGTNGNSTNTKDQFSLVDDVDESIVDLDSHMNNISKSRAGISIVTALTLSEEKTATGRPLKSAQFSSLRFHLRARLIDVQKKSIFETVKPSHDPILGVNWVAGTEENFGGYYVEVQARDQRLMVGG